MKKFDIMDACNASAKDFCETLLFCLEDDGIFTKEDGSLDEELTLLQEEGNKIEKWLKEAGYTDKCIGAGFTLVEGHQGRAMDFEYNGNIEEFVDLATAISENVIDDRFSVMVFVYDEEDEGYKNIFCVEIWLNE